MATKDRGESKESKPPTSGNEQDNMEQGYQQDIQLSGRGDSC